jgi:hypothetical protein
LIDICPILMDMQCHPGLYFYSNVMSYINVFLQILIVIAPQRLGLMQGHSEPEYFLWGKTTNSKFLSHYMGFVLNIFYIKLSVPLSFDFLEVYMCDLSSWFLFKFNSWTCIIIE